MLHIDTWLVVAPLRPAEMRSLLYEYDRNTIE